MRKLLGRPSPATLISSLALFVALGGTGYAALKLPANSVGSKQIKKNAVTSAKIKSNAVTGAKVKAETLTGADIVESALAKVPAAAAADTAAKAATADKATTADKAGSADTAAKAATATTADTATSVAEPEAWHTIGSAGNPAFQNGCGAYAEGDPPDTVENYIEPPAFYKDRSGVVHLKGLIECPGSGAAVFSLPVGYRPANGKIRIFRVDCLAGCTATDSGSDTVDLGSGRIVVVGTGTATDGSIDGAILNGGPRLSLDGVSFRAEG